MMLGAQARAAEYTAARNASARQASREAEEQKLPPKSVPISLGAFTKNVQVNRNKGNKVWIPLVLEDTNEEENSSTHDDNSNSTMTNPRTNNLDMEDLWKPALSRNTSHIRVNLPQNTIPIAPRAMLTNEISNFPPEYHVSCQPEQQILDNEQFNHTQPFIFDSPQNHNDRPSPRHHHDWMHDLPPILPMAHMPTQTPKGIRRIGNMMVPTDISPTKQEQKLSMLLYKTPNPLTSIKTPNNPERAMGKVNPQQSPKTIDQMHQEAFEFGWELLQERNTSARKLLSRSSSNRPYPDIPTSKEIDIPHPFVPSSLSRQLSHPNYRTNNMKYTRLPPNYLHQTNSRAYLRSNENDEPYDRNTKLQQFAAARQALARTGKTVLHNPEIRKKVLEEKENIAGLSQNRGQVATPASNSSDWLALTHDDMATPANTHDSALPSVEPLISPQDAALRSEFNIERSTWFELKSVTCAERKHMSDIFKNIALEMKIEESESRGLARTVRSIKNTPRSSHIDEWMKTDSRGLQTARAAVDRLANDYVEHLRLKGEDPFQISEQTSEIVDLDGGKIRAVGNVLANLTEQVIEHDSETRRQDYFTRIKAVPNYAIVGNWDGFGGEYFFQNYGIPSPKEIVKEKEELHPSKKMTGSMLSAEELDDLWNCRPVTSW